MRRAALALACGLAAASLAWAAGPTCRERTAALDERRGELAVALEETQRETAEVQRRTDALDAERRTVDGSTDRFLVDEFNTRARLHRARVDAHNQRVGALNGDVDALNRQIAVLRSECATGRR
jgi:chromosome segregation ATPase